MSPGPAGHLCLRPRCGQDGLVASPGAATVLITHAERDLQAPWRAIAALVPISTGAIEETQYYGEGKTPVEAFRHLLAGVDQALEEAAE